MNFSNAISLLSSWNGEEDFQAMLANRPEQERFALLKDLDDFMQYIGYAGEMRVMSELLVRGVEALNGRVDDGFDLVAMRGDEVFLVQVKTAFLGKDYLYSFNIADGNGVAEYSGAHKAFFVFVLVGGEGERMDFVVLSRSGFDKELKAGNAWHMESTKRYRVKIYLRDGRAFFGKVGNDRTDLLNDWSPFLGKGGADRASESLA